MNEEIPQKEMIACEGCGGYHEKSECEIIVIKIVKGRGCTLPSFKRPTANVPVQSVPVHVPAIVTNASDTQPVPSAPMRTVQPVKKIIPKAITDLMTPPPMQ